MKKLLVSSFLFMAALTGCGGSSDSSPQASNPNQLNGKAYRLEGAKLVEQTNSLIKAGMPDFSTITFEEPMEEVQSAHNFQLDFKLEDGGTVELNAFQPKDGANSSNQVTLAFHRVGNELQLMTSDSVSEMGFVHTLNGIDASEEIKLSVDVHNDENGSAHVIIWNGKFCKKHPKLFNSEAAGIRIALGKGPFWGVSLKGAELSRADLSAAWDNHDGDGEDKKHRFKDK